LQTYQTVKYQIYPVLEIQDFIKSADILNDEEAYTLSLECEPRV
jgi:hypothetical protein